MSREPPPLQIGIQLSKIHIFVDFSIELLKMGKKNLTIGEISEILNITPSTLRFWEKENLFHVSKKSNHYRTYTNTDLIDIADILYYRNLGVPVKDIRAFSSLELSEYDQFLENQERELNKKIEEYQQMLLRSQSLKRNYYRLLRLLVNPFILETPDFHHVISWDFREKERIRQYVSDPSYYVWCKDTNSEISGRKGLIVSENSSYSRSDLIWENRPGSRYISFPVKAMIENDYSGLEAPKIVAEVQRHTTTGYLITRHLLNCKINGENVEYLQAYLEITGAWDDSFTKRLMLD